jgi:hypothetical protein
MEQSKRPDFFYCPASRNLDNVAHTIVDYQFAPSQTFMGFEDIFGGGDFDYDDLQFTLSNVRSSVPNGGGTTAMLPGSAVVVLAFLRRFTHRCRKAAQGALGSR